MYIINLNSGMGTHQASSLEQVVELVTNALGYEVTIKPYQWNRHNGAKGVRRWSILHKRRLDRHNIQECQGHIETNVEPYDRETYLEWIK